MQISPVSIHHHLCKFPAQPCHLLPHPPHQTVKLNHDFQWLYCFQDISEEENALGTHACMYA